MNERNENARFADVLAGVVHQANLGSQRGFEGRGALHIAQGQAVLVLEHLLRAGRGLAYGLWAIKGNKLRSSRHRGFGTRRASPR